MNNSKEKQVYLYAGVVTFVLVLVWVFIFIPMQNKDRDLSRPDIGIKEKAEVGKFFINQLRETKDGETENKVSEESDVVNKANDEVLIGNAEHTSEIITTN